MNSLITAYEYTGLTRKVELLMKLVQLKLEQFRYVQDYVNEVVVTSFKLQNAGLSIGAEVVASFKSKVNGRQC